jgi:uncharacterized protein YecE (DUF72 family)
MRLLAGTSGFSYKEWLGEFYPDKLPAKGMLGYYASQLPAVEINNTFYRMPNKAAIEGWRAQVPAAFRFAIKVPRRITHSKRLADCAEEIGFLLSALTALGSCFGSLLVQLPPYSKCDVRVLTEFLGELPGSCRTALEFRHESWLVPEVFELLRAHNAALVQSESDADFAVLPWTANWAYLRLRKVSYGDDELRGWLARLRAAEIAEAQVFFKHEDAATGPKLAMRMLALAAE